MAPLAGVAMSTTEKSWAIPSGLPKGGFIVPDPSFHHGEPPTEPALWITDEPVANPGVLFGQLLALHGQTGLWPLLLTEHAPFAGVPVPDFFGVPAERVQGHLFPPGRPWHNGEISPVPAQDIDGLNAAQILASRWQIEASDRPDLFDFGEDAFPGMPRSGWPGLADPATPGHDPDEVAAALGRV